MVLSRAAALPKGLSRTVLRRAGSSARNRSWRQVGRRGYASEHGHQEGSEIPWMIGSAAVTIPAAAWLLQQGPKKSDHGHGAPHEQSDEEEKEDGEEEKSQEEQPKEEESQDDSKDQEKQDSSEDTDESKDESSDDSKSDDSSKEDSEDSGKDSEDAKAESKGSADEENDGPGPNAPKQINWTSASNKGPGEGQKGERKPSEKKGEKDSQGDFSGAKHPYINDAEKSKKGVGVTETAKIHGTVDPSLGSRGVKESGSSSSE